MIPFTHRKCRIPLLRYASLFVLCLFLSLLTGCAKKRTIVNGQEEKEANEIIVLLSTKGINADKVKSIEATTGGAQKVTLWDISVPDEETTSAMSILNNAGLPRKKSQNLLNIFSNTGLVPTDMAEKIRYQAGLASQIAGTIRNIDGVLDADVLISFPEQDPLNPTAPKKDITASVYVKHSGVLDDPNTHLASKIKSLVTSSVSGLKYENVTLVPDRARFTDLPPGGISKSDEDLQYVKVWGITVGKDSVTMFRIIFFTFCIILLLLILIIVWIGWKTFPLLNERGGIKELFNLKSMNPNASHSEENKEEENSTETDAEKVKRKKSEENSLADESADFAGDLNVYDEDEREK